MISVTLPAAARRLLETLVPALLGQGQFTPGRPEGPRALAVLGEDLCAWLTHQPRLVLLGGNPGDPLTCAVLGLADEVVDPMQVIAAEARPSVQMHLGGFWRDRRLVLISLRQGLIKSEFDYLLHLLNQHACKGELLRKRVYDEQQNGRLAHVSLVFLDDLRETGPSLFWSGRIALSWLHRDLNLLAHARSITAGELSAWRKNLLSAALELPQKLGRLADFFADLDLVAENIEGYDKDELVFSLLENLDQGLYGELCLQLCTKLERLHEKLDKQEDANTRKRLAALLWVTRRLAEQMMEDKSAGPEHFHALVLQKVLLYEEIPQSMRPRVASLQVLTSFLANPQRYFAEIEASHSPEVLSTRLWRIQEMLPRMVQALRFDAARQVLEFVQRYGTTFELKNRPDIMQQLLAAAAGVLSEVDSGQQAALMQTLPQMGRTGIHLLIGLADHDNRSVRRFALDGLTAVGPPITTILFESLATKPGWHYLRNMLVLLGKINAGGPKVEELFRKSLAHSEAHVRREALPGLARLLKENAFEPVAAALADVDPEVRKRAVACLGMTGIADPAIFRRLGTMLSARGGGEDLAVQIVATINRLKLTGVNCRELEEALQKLIAPSGFLGFGASGHVSPALRQAAVQALGYVGGKTSINLLKKLSGEQNKGLAVAASEALSRLQQAAG